MKTDAVRPCVNSLASLGHMGPTAGHQFATTVTARVPHAAMHQKSVCLAGAYAGTLSVIQCLGWRIGTALLFLNLT